MSEQDSTDTPPDEQPGVPPEERDVIRRARIDRSCRGPVMFFVLSAVGWLLIGTILAILASTKLHSPELLSDTELLTFGRVRPAHLNTVIYGWSSLVGIGVLLWLQARLARAPLRFHKLLYGVGILWNLAVLGGTIALLTVHFESVEWLEFPVWTAACLGIGFIGVMIASLDMFRRRTKHHIFVSQWYLFGAVFWFPILYVLANLMIRIGLATGIAQATANWWFAHNVLGIWFTPIGLAAAYYFIPKVLGRPIHSYYLSLLGFWTLALFYNWAGTHHLIGGPLPVWLTTVGTVASMMMFIPVVTVAINHHMTMVGHFEKLKFSPTLRFIVFGAMSYTLVSVQGSLMALRTVNETTHFTHYTIAHAHLGMYAFFTMAMFGAVYYIVPRLLGREWPSVTLIKVHFWTTATGIFIYFTGLSWGGWRQGEMMNHDTIDFLEIVEYLIPYLWSRSFGGILMTVGHVAFAILLWKMWRGGGDDKATGDGPVTLAASEPTTDVPDSSTDNPEVSP